MRRSINEKEHTMKIHNHMTVVLAVVLAALNAVAANFPVGTHLVKGTLKDWQNNVLTSSAAVTIQAVATNGTVIASTPVANPSADGYNFLLQIPLSTTATDSTAAVGDQLNCVLIQETGLALAASPITVGNANAVSSLAMAVQLSARQDAGAANDENAALAKMQTARMARESVALGREVLGGNGILLENDAARFFADAEAIYSYEGTREMNTLIVGRALTGFAAFV
jgi:hypothetical protein